MSRLDDLKAKLFARTDPNTGKPVHGYRQNCAAIKAEISRLESVPTGPSDVPMESALDKLTADVEALAGYPKDVVLTCP